MRSSNRTDFATASRPHNMQELIGAVNDALAVTIWYRPVWDLLTEQTERTIINVFF